MQKNQKIKILQVVAVTGLLAIYPIYRIYQDTAWQEVWVPAATKNGFDENGLSDDVTIKIKQESMIPGHSYQIVIGYRIINELGEGLFCKFPQLHEIDGKVAMLGCSDMEASVSFVAAKRNIALQMSLAIDPKEIFTEDGTVFDPKTQKLCPMIKKINKLE